MKTLQNVFIVMRNILNLIHFVILVILQILTLILLMFYQSILIYLLNLHLYYFYLYTFELLKLQQLLGQKNFLFSFPILNSILVFRRIFVESTTVYHSTNSYFIHLLEPNLRIYPSSTNTCSCFHIFFEGISSPIRF